MAAVNGSYTFEIDGDTVKFLGPHPKSNLMTIVIQGLCTNPDGDTFDFVARNNLDMSYADRFKVNWNGNKPRLPEAAGVGFDDETKEGRRITPNLLMTRGARIAIARRCMSLFPTAVQVAMGSKAREDAEAASVPAPKAPTPKKSRTKKPAADKS